jgi:hypothetical protein
LRPDREAAGFIVEQRAVAGYIAGSGSQAVETGATMRFSVGSRHPAGAGWLLGLGLLLAAAAPAREPVKEPDDDEPKKEENEDRKAPTKPGELWAYITPEKAFEDFLRLANGKADKELATVVGRPWIDFLKEFKLLDQNNNQNWQVRAQLLGLMPHGVFFGRARQGYEAKIDAKAGTAKLAAGNHVLPYIFAKTDRGWVFTHSPEEFAKLRLEVQKLFCQTNLSMFFQMLNQHAAQARTGRFPDRLDEVAWQNKELPLCPGVAKNAHAPGLGKLQHCDYIYLPGVEWGQNQFQPTNQQVLLAFDRKGNHPDGRWALYSNGQIKWITNDRELAKEVHKALQRLGVPPGGPKDSMPPTAEDLKRYREAVANLGSEEYAVREAANKLLAEAGEAARGPLEEALKSLDLETKERAGQLLKKIMDRKLLKPWFEMLSADLDLGAPAKSK